MDIILDEKAQSQRMIATGIPSGNSVLERLSPVGNGSQVDLHGGPAPLAGRGFVGTAAGKHKPLDFSLYYFAAPECSSQQEMYRLLMEGVRFADEKGFCAVWTPERHFHPFGGIYPNPSVTGAAVAVVTKRIEIRAGSVVLPLHDPLRVVEEWSVVDNLSGGRVAISFASGWHANDFALAPEHFKDRRRIMLEGIETVRSLWRGNAVSRRNGVGHDISIKVYPKPLQSELPVWLTASGNPETFRAAGEIGAGLLTALLGQDLNQLSQKIALYRSTFREAGHPGHGRVAVMLHTFVGKNDEDTRSLVHDPFFKYLENYLALLENLGRTLGAGSNSGRPSKRNMDALLRHAFERYYATNSLMGGLQSCMTTLERLAAADVDEVACLIDFGVGLQATLDSLPRLDELKKNWAQGPHRQS